MIDPIWFILTAGLFGFGFGRLSAYPGESPTHNRIGQIYKELDRLQVRIQELEER